MSEHAASRELCEELYELSGWRDTHSFYTKTGKVSTEASMYSSPPLPAYSLGYLLRKLPSHISDDDGNVYRLRSGKNQYYFFEYQRKDDHQILWWGESCFSKDSPENAAIQLIIKLFRRDVPMMKDETEDK